MELRKHRVAALPPGAIVADRYKVLKVIGMGGFGITYRAWDVEQERQLVVKECFPTEICRRDAATNAIVPRHEALSEAYFGGIEDMIREARTLRSLQHEHIVPVYDVVFGSGCVFCAMQWLSGGSLKDRIRSGTPMSAKESMHHLSCLLSALSYTHSRDVIHRDIKPENIMFDENGQVKLIDFGAALNRSMRTSGITTQGAYSPEYVSPEQFTCKGKIGPWTDFYLLAATWYELLTGNPPESVASRLMQDTLPPLTPEIIREPYPPALLDTLWRNLSLNPSSRCQSADEWNIC